MWLIAEEDRVKEVHELYTKENAVPDPEPVVEANNTPRAHLLQLWIY
jgi:hypothetical protein